MSHTIPNHKALNKTTLTPIIKKAPNNTKIELKKWNINQIHGGLGQGTSIHKLTGTAKTSTKTIEWSLILKTLQPNKDNTNKTKWNYYRREADLYQSGTLDTLKEQLKAPKCYGINSFQDGTTWIWLQNIKDKYDGKWPLEYYKTAARHIGQFNGTYLTEKKLPEQEWLSQNWLRHNVEQATNAIETLKTSDHPLLLLMFPDDLKEKTLTLWDEREKYLDALDQLPQTFCHYDTFRRNLFACQREDNEFETVLIDWAFAGIGPIGADLNPLVRASISLYEVDFASVEKLEALTLEGYLSGLRDVGWDGDLRQVRLGYAASNIRFTLGSLKPVFDNTLVMSDDGRGDIAFGDSVEERMVHFSRIRNHFLQLYEDANKLIEDIYPNNR